MDPYNLNNRSGDTMTFTGRVIYNDPTDHYSPYFKVKESSNFNITDTTSPKSIIPYSEYIENKK